MRTRQLNAIKRLEAEGYIVKVVDQNFNEEFILYAHSGGLGPFGEYIVSSAGKLIHVKDYPYSKSISEYFQNAETLPLGPRRTVGLHHKEEAARSA